jgi:S-adenosylmethionine-diacylglycerol 3-amino-3-carboxypropyl transferase
MPVALINKVANYTRDRIFKKIHGNNLIYNACWEDPRIDRAVMNIKGNSRIVMITSAGCNALDYVLDQPESIDTIDVNPRQNALMELKMAVFRNGTYEDLFAMFGRGYHDDLVNFYNSRLRNGLPAYARSFWDEKLKYFKRDSLKKSFYFNGTSGNFAWFMQRYIKTHPLLKKRVERLLSSSNLEEQAKAYEAIEPILWNFIVRWIMRRHTTMALLGVPRAQRELIKNDYPGGIMNFLRSSLYNVFTKTPMDENYFWRAYLTGSYTEVCSPNYLKPENFNIIRENLHRIRVHNNHISGFLRENPAQCTHYVLLDHQDWLAWNDLEALNEEWDLILKNSIAGKTNVLLRSAGIRRDFLPDFVLKAVEFHDHLAEKWHHQDRVGTYASMHFGTVK